MCIPLSLFTPVVPLTNLPSRNNLLKGDFYHSISSFSPFIAPQNVLPTSVLTASPQVACFSPHRESPDFL